MTETLLLDRERGVLTVRLNRIGQGAGGGVALRIAAV